MVRPVLVEHADEHRDDDVRDGHEDGAPDKERTSPDAVHAPDTCRDADELGYVQDSGHDQLVVVVETHGFEERWGVVDEGVDSDELPIC